MTPSAPSFVDTEWGLIEVTPVPCATLPTPCLVTGYKPDGDGYPVTRKGGKGVRVHRAACEWAHGPPTPPTLVVLHLCDHPACVNPAHLRWGTQAENIADMVAKGRHRPRAAAPRSNPARHDAGPAPDPKPHPP